MKKQVISVAVFLYSIVSLASNNTASDMTVEDLVNFSGTFKLSDQCLKMRDKGFARSERNGFLPDVPKGWKESNPKEEIIKIQPYSYYSLSISGAGYSMSMNTSSRDRSESGSGNGILLGHESVKDTFDRNTMTMTNTAFAFAIFPPQKITIFESLQLVNSEKVIVTGPFFDGWWFYRQSCELQRISKFSYTSIAQVLVDEKTKATDSNGVRSLNSSVESLRISMERVYERATDETLKSDLKEAVEALDAAFGQDFKSLIPRKAAATEY